MKRPHENLKYFILQRSFTRYLPFSVTPSPMFSVTIYPRPLPAWRHGYIKKRGQHWVALATCIYSCPILLDDGMALTTCTMYLIMIIIQSIKTISVCTHSLTYSSFTVRLRITNISFIKCVFWGKGSFLLHPCLL